MKQEYFNIDYQGVTINTFSFKEVVKNIDKAVIDFVKSDFFKIDCTRDFIKEKPQKEQDEFLKSSFNLDKLKIQDFKKMDYQEFCNYFDDYAKVDFGESDEGKDFLEIWYKLKEKLEELKSNYSIYLISKEWFENAQSKVDPENADERLSHPEFWCYIYYFLCVAINEKDKKLIEFTLFYD